MDSPGRKWWTTIPGDVTVLCIENAHGLVYARVCVCLRTLPQHLRGRYDGLEEEDRLAKRKAQCVAMADSATNHAERGNQLDLIHVRSSVLYGSFESRPGSNGRLIIVGSGGVSDVGGDGNVVVPGLNCRFWFHDRPRRPPNCEATVRLVSRDPAGRDFLTTFRTKERTYSNIRHIIVTALSRRGLPGIFDLLWLPSSSNPSGHRQPTLGGPLHTSP